MTILDRIFKNEHIIIYKRIGSLRNTADKRYFVHCKHTNKSTGTEFRSITQVNKFIKLFNNIDIENNRKEKISENREQILIEKLKELYKISKGSKAKEFIGAADAHEDADDLLLEYIDNKKISHAFLKIERWYE